MPRLVDMGTPPADLPSRPPTTQVVGQQSSPSTVVPMGGGLGPGSTLVGGRRMNTLAVVSLVTALISPFGWVTGIGGLALIITSIVTGHMARAEIRRTGEEGATLALIGLIIGALVGTNALGAKAPWITFLAGTGAIVLTFLAGA